MSRTTIGCAYLGTLGVILFIGGCSVEMVEPSLAEARSSLLEVDTLGRELGPITSSIVTNNREAETSARLLARLEVQRNEILEFYEPLSGHVVLSLAGAPAEPSLYAGANLNKSSHRELWSEASNGSPVPPNLEEAFKREEARVEAARGGSAIVPLNARKARRDPMIQRSASGSSEERQGPHALAQSAQAPSFTLYCDSTYFSEGWGDCPSYDVQVCIDNHWNGAWAAYHDAAIGYTNVCAATGPVLLRVQSDEGFGVVWSVNQDSGRQYGWDDNWCSVDPFDDCPWVRSDVEQATGDRFHFRYLTQDE
jgi:hypothetical protein